MPCPTLMLLSSAGTNRYFKGYWHRDILDLHRQYGPVVRISPNEVSIVSPELGKPVYSYTGGTPKTGWYDVWRALGGTEGRNSTAVSFFGSTDPNEHAFLRRRVSTTCTMSAVMDYLAPRFGLGIANYRRGFLRVTVEKVLQRMNDKTKYQRERDMLDHFLDMTGPQGQPVTLPELLADVGNLFAAGADTSSVAIRVVLLPLLTDPACYQRLKSEIDAVRAAVGITGDAEKALSYHDIKVLSFLSACVKEGSRMHPSIIWQLPRKAPSEGINIEGHYISPSATVSMSPLAQNRCQAIFGKDADEWRPERWIAGEVNPPERIKEMDKNLATVNSYLTSSQMDAMLTVNTVCLRFPDMCRAELGNI
ncbi:hypothetical protein FJTKL_01712 [Diaporthe vaccinii]|uniref:Cytochrome P450 n=1 Tax=Diaporthe vaccinii TaxID=105482 RepID=A0ABR4DZQ1_9PEZI